MASDLKSIFKHSSVYGFAGLLQKGIGFFMIPVYTGFLSPSDYGILELMDLTINIISMLIGMRLGAGIIRFYHKYELESEKELLFSTALISAAALTFFIVFILFFFSDFFAEMVLGNASYFKYFQVIFVAMGCQIISTVPESILLAEQKSVMFSTVTILTLISYLSFNILFLVVFRMGVMGILLSMLITKTFNTSCLILIIRKKIKPVFSLRILKVLVKFTLPLVPASVFMFAMHYSDRFFIQKFCDLNQLGLYSLGYKFGMMISVLISEPFFRIWNTKRFEIAKEADSSKTMGSFFTYYSFITLFAATGISLFIREVIIIMAPEAYYNATHMVSMIAASYIFYGAANFFTLGMMITYNTKSLAFIQISTSVFNIILNYFLISRWGLNGAVSSTFISFFFMASLSFIKSQSLFSIKIEYKRILMLWSVFIICAYISNVYIFSSLIILSLLIKSVIFISLPFILYITGFFRKDEKEKIFEALKLFKEKIIENKG
ncbi:MAG: hypothetical protein CSB21_01655 [Deltaproteobacteria bacterium]|nr:MAG: hypothetical protein CSB21_01655 [Deltaproteobacteria bacterium]